MRGGGIKPKRDVHKSDRASQQPSPPPDTKRKEEIRNWSGKWSMVGILSW